MWRVGGKKQGRTEDDERNGRRRVVAERKLHYEWNMDKGNIADRNMKAIYTTIPGGRDG